MTSEPTLAIVVMGIITILAQIYRESRQRHWDAEDRRRVADDLARTVLAQTDAVAIELKRTRLQSLAGHVELKQALQETHDAAREAYHEANSVNTKIGDLNARLLANEQENRPDTPARPMA